MKIALVSDEIIDINFADVDYFCSNDEIKPSDWVNYDIAILTPPYSEEALKRWTGHPHLRCCDTLNDIKKEVRQLEENIESERKYLIEYPCVDALKLYYPYKYEIVQVYLEFEQGTRRIRKRSADGITLYYETVKINLSDTASREYEQLISKEEYKKLLASADKTKRPIVKKRYCFVYKKQYFELDVFDFWNDKAVLEIELCDESEKVLLPPEIKVIKDVTTDYRYKNSQLARIDYEDN